MSLLLDTVRNILFICPLFSIKLSILTFITFSLIAYIVLSTCPQLVVSYLKKTEENTVLEKRTEIMNLHIFQMRLEPKKNSQYFISTFANLSYSFGC